MTRPAKLHHVNGFDALQAVQGALQIHGEPTVYSTGTDAIAFLSRLEEMGFFIGVPDLDHDKIPTRQDSRKADET